LNWGIFWSAIGGIFGIFAFLLNLFLYWPELKRRYHESRESVIAIKSILSLVYVCFMLILTFLAMLSMMLGVYFVVFDGSWRDGISSSNTQQFVGYFLASLGMAIFVFAMLDKKLNLAVKPLGKKGIMILVFFLFTTWLALHGLDYNFLLIFETITSLWS